ncbi:MAG TPA: cyclase family protein [Thermoanaerobaculia bacterium]|nr:cyclase family protein [Thermoanaerobaculia bacterium]
MLVRKSRSRMVLPVLALVALVIRFNAVEAASPPIDLQGVKVVDLTYSFDDKTIYWPTAPTTFQLNRMSFGKTEAGYFYAANSFCTPEHGGTHLDAPIHFAEGKRTADQIPVEQLIAPAVVMDVSAKAAADPDYRLTLEDVRAWEAKHGPIAQGVFVLLRTGWGKRWPDRKRYLGDDKPNDASNLHFPSYGAEAARYLVEQRKVGALGVDTASIDHGPSKDFIVHQIANGANVPGVENVANLEEVPETGAWVIALPMKIAGGSGGPVRVVALVPGRR